MCSCDYKPDEDDDVESPIEHPDVTKARDAEFTDAHLALGEKEYAWYRQGGLCFNCQRPLGTPMRFMLCTDDHLRCFGCKQTFTLAPLATLENQRAVA